MAFSKGNESTEGVQVKRYTGVGSVYIKGVNPSKKELEEFFEREVDKEPEYVGEREIDGNKVPQVRIDFLTEADSAKYKDSEGNPLKFRSRVSIFLVKAPRVSRAGKKQVIDKYGRTAWATPEEIAAKKIPVNSNGSNANISANYRIAYQGEEDLVNFFIAYLGIPAPAKYVDGKWIDLEPAKLVDSEAYLEHIEDYFKGDFKELRENIKIQPNNKVKILFGVRKADDGREFQTAYTRRFLKNNTTTYTSLQKLVSDTQSNGGYPSSEFEVSELHEYVVEPSNLENTPTSVFDNIDNTPTPWIN